MLSGLVIDRMFFQLHKEIKVNDYLHASEPIGSTDLAA